MRGACFISLLIVSAGACNWHFQVDQVDADVSFNITTCSGSSIEVVNVLSDTSYDECLVDSLVDGYMVSVIGSESPTWRIVGNTEFISSHILLSSASETNSVCPPEGSDWSCLSNPNVTNGNLTGCHFLITTVGTIPLVYFDDINRGWIPDLIAQTANYSQILYGGTFTYELLWPRANAELSTYGQGQNDTYCGFTDMFWSGFYITPNRMEKVVMTQPFASRIGLQLAVEKEGTDSFEQRVHLIFQPFTAWMWGTITMLVPLGGLMVYIAEDGSHSSDFDGDGGVTYDTFVANIGKSTWLAFTSFTGAHAHYPRSSVGRIVTAAWTFLALIVMSVYTANLSANLTLAAKLSPIDSIAFMAHNGFPSCVIKGTAYKAFLETHDTYKKMIMQDCDNVADCVDKLREGLCDGIVLPFVWADYMTESLDHCTTDFEMIRQGDPIDDGPQDTGVGVTNGLAPVADGLSYLFITMRSAGVTEELTETWVRLGECGARDFSIPSAEAKKLDVTDLSGLWIVLGSVFSLILISMVVIFIRKRHPEDKDIPDLQLYLEARLQQWVTFEKLLEVFVGSSKESIQLRAELRPIVTKYLRSVDKKLARDWKRDSVVLQFEDVFLLSNPDGDHAHLKSNPCPALKRSEEYLKLCLEKLNLKRKTRAVENYLKHHAHERPGYMSHLPSKFSKYL